MITQRIDAHLARAKRAIVSVGKHLGDGRSETPTEKSLPNVLWEREIEKFIIRQPPMGEKDDYDSENSWISDGLPSSRWETSYRLFFNLRVFIKWYNFFKC